MVQRIVLTLVIILGFIELIAAATARFVPGRHHTGLGWIATAVLVLRDVLFHFPPRVPLARHAARRAVCIAGTDNLRAAALQSEQK